MIPDYNISTCIVIAFFFQIKMFTFIYATMPSRVPDRTIKNLVVKVVDPQLENDNFIF